MRGTWKWLEVEWNGNRIELYQVCQSHSVKHLLAYCYNFSNMKEVTHCVPKGQRGQRRLRSSDLFHLMMWSNRLFCGSWLKSQISKGESFLHDLYHPLAAQVGSFWGMAPKLAVSPWLAQSLLWGRGIRYRWVECSSGTLEGRQSLIFFNLRRGCTPQKVSP